jgi:hypothetical protein
VDDLPVYSVRVQGVDVQVSLDDAHSHPIPESEEMDEVRE